jgi:hypothetical protein
LLHFYFKDEGLIFGVTALGDELDGVEKQSFIKNSQKNLQRGMLECEIGSDMCCGIWAGRKVLQEGKGKRFLCNFWMLNWRAGSQLNRLPFLKLGSNGLIIKLIHLESLFFKLPSLIQIHLYFT